MFKKTTLLLLAALMICSFAACSNNSTSSESSSSTEAVSSEEQTATVEETEADSSEAAAAEGASTSQASALESKVPNTLAEDEESLIANNSDKFTQETYTDSDTGLSITYNLYLPEGYDESQSYPMVVFIADSSCVGNDPTVSLTQGRGALVWATEEWQSANPTIVAVPTYPETILDDHDSYTTTEYVDLTKRYIDYMSSEYAVDTNRIYGTGQSMGCMTTLILASQYPDLYAACMFVDGQWDVSTLKGLEGQKFVYFAAEDDTRAWEGAQEVMSMFDTDSVSYKYAQWDGTWSVDDLSAAAADLFTEDEKSYFISWASGTIEAQSGGAGMGGNNGGNMPDMGGEKPDMSDMEANTGDMESSTGDTASNTGGMGSSSYHMASFDYAYNCVAVMEWLFAQSK